MTTDELQTVVILEAICLALIVIIIVSGFKRWKSPLIVSTGLVTATFFLAWSPVMALGSSLVYTPASVLLWVELGKEKQLRKTKVKIIRGLAWTVLAIGVATIILKNIYNILIYLG